MTRMEFIHACFWMLGHPMIAILSIGHIYAGIEVSKQRRDQNFWRIKLSPFTKVYRVLFTNSRLIHFLRRISAISEQNQG